MGQILEREFDVKENNLSIRDLGSFELKGMRRSSGTLTLGHKTTSTGLKPLEIFDRYGYVKPSNRDGNILKKKLFCTVKGNRHNRNGFVLIAQSDHEIELSHSTDGYLATWDLTDTLPKIDQVVVVFAETQGRAGAKDERFHYTHALRLSGLSPLSDLIREDKFVVDFCIDQPLDLSRPPHDRGPHLRLRRSKLTESYAEHEWIRP